MQEIFNNYIGTLPKTKESDYFKKIIEWNPKILIEIHDHGGNKAKYDIEISSGMKERNKWSKEMAEKLVAKLSNSEELKRYSISGDFNEIFFQASKAETINTKKWLPFHIELPKSLRISKSQYIVFCEKLAEAIKEIYNSYNKS